MNTSHATSIGQRLQRERIRLNWSQERLAEAIGTTARSINRWERDKAVPQHHYREQLCHIFQQHADALFRTEEHTPVQLEECSLIWNVPYQRNPFFTGREHILSSLHTMLSTESRAAVTLIQAISGMGGIGKTQTVAEYAHRYRDDYYAVLWARADTREILSADVASIADLLHLPEVDGRDLPRIGAAVKRWLSNHTHWLLILDNVEDFTVLQEVIPSDRRGSLLLTTRAQAVSALACHIDLKQMEPEEGAMFLLRRAKLLAPEARLAEAPEVLRTSALRIAQAMDGFPLALDQAGAYIEETGCSLSDYLDRYEHRRALMLDLRGGASIDHPQSVRATFTLSFEKVQCANPAAADLLRFCTCLHPDAIPEEMIIAGASELGPLLQTVVTDPLTFDATIASVRTCSLLHRNAEAKTFTMHRLVQTILKDRMDTDEQRLWAERTVRVMNRVFPNVQEQGGWSLCQRYMPHGQVCAHLIEQWNLQFLEAAQLLTKTGAYLREVAQYTQAQSYYHLALSMYEQVVGLEHPNVAETLNDLGVLAHTQGKYAEAELCYQRALAFREHHLGPEHPDVAESLNNLAYLYYNQDKYAQAEPLYHRALTILRQTLGPEHLYVAMTLSNLARLYQRAGKVSEAESLDQRACLLLEQAMGPEHPYVAICLNSLAVLYIEQARYAEAEPLLERALNIREKSLGAEHPSTAQSQNEQGKLYMLQGKYAKAEILLQRALVIQEKTLGLEDPAVATTLENYALLLTMTKREAEAATVVERVRQIRTKQ